MLQQNNKREAVLRMIERVENEIRAGEEAGIKLQNAARDNEAQIKSNTERLVQAEDDIQELKSKGIVELESQIESYERKLESTRFFVKKHQVEIDKIKMKLEGNPSSATLKMELKEKQEEFEKKKKNEDDLLAKRQAALDAIRTIHVEIRHHTQEAIGIEDHIHKAQMNIRSVKQNIRKNQRVLLELQEKLARLCVELEGTNRLKPFTPFLRSRSQMRPLSEPAARANTLDVETHMEYKVSRFGYTDYYTVVGRRECVNCRVGTSFRGLPITLLFLFRYPRNPPCGCSGGKFVASRPSINVAWVRSPESNPVSYVTRQ